MNIFITFDYELFFGPDSGTQEKSIIQPTQKLLQVLDKQNIKASFFVDSGYIIKLNEYRQKYLELEKEYQTVMQQIKELNANGHDVQLHIHPHWEDSYYDGAKWVFNTTRYRLHEFNDKDIDDILYRYKKVLTDIVGDKVFTYRAGGWCLQPFDKISNALQKHNIWLDSTVFQKGKNESLTHFFDFINAPDKDIWKFSMNPLIENNKGFFTEVPISSTKVSPLFYWKFALFKKFGGVRHKMFGDGQGLSSGSKLNKLKMLFLPSNMAVSTDGYKISLLQKAFESYCKRRKALQYDNFITIGHPKALTPFALKELELFISQNSSHNYTTYSKEFNHEK